MGSTCCRRIVAAYTAIRVIEQLLAFYVGGSVQNLKKDCASSVTPATQQKISRIADRFSSNLKPVPAVGRWVAFADLFPQLGRAQTVPLPEVPHKVAWVLNADRYPNLFHPHKS